MFIAGTDFSEVWQESSENLLDSFHFFANRWWIWKLKLYFSFQYWLKSVSSKFHLQSLIFESLSITPSLIIIYWNHLVTKIHPCHALLLNLKLKIQLTTCQNKHVNNFHTIQTMSDTKYSRWYYQFNHLRKNCLYRYKPRCLFSICVFIYN